MVKLRADLATLSNLSSMKFKKAPTIKKKVGWCAVHHRIADYYDTTERKYRCDPALGGIMLPCSLSDTIP